VNEGSNRVLLFALGLAAGCGAATAYSYAQRRELAVVLQSSEAMASMLAKVHEECRGVRAELRRTPQNAAAAPAPPSQGERASGHDGVPTQAASAQPEEPETGDWDKAIRAQTLLDGALRSGTWDLTARDELRLLAAEMPDSERAQIHLELARNINEGKLRVEGPISPF
jgi:hypothetical protein